MKRVVNVRRLGCASLDLCYVANGRFDAFWERGLHSWDIAAGSLIVREAGGFVTDCDGGAEFLKSGDICCGNEFIHREMLELLRGGDVNRRIGVIPGLTRAPAADASMQKHEIRS